MVQWVGCFLDPGETIRNQDSDVPLVCEDTVLVRSFMGSKLVLKKSDLLWFFAGDSVFWIFYIISIYGYLDKTLFHVL